MSESAWNANCVVLELPMGWSHPLEKTYWDGDARVTQVIAEPFTPDILDRLRQSPKIAAIYALGGQERISRNAPDWESAPRYEQVMLVMPASGVSAAEVRKVTESVIREVARPGYDERGQDPIDWMHASHARVSPANIQSSSPAASNPHVHIAQGEHGAGIMMATRQMTLGEANEYGSRLVSVFASERSVSGPSVHVITQDMKGDGEVPLTRVLMTFDGQILSEARSSWEAVQKQKGLPSDSSTAQMPGALIALHGHALQAASNRLHQAASRAGLGGVGSLKLVVARPVLES